MRIILTGPIGGGFPTVVIWESSVAGITLKFCKWNAIWVREIPPVQVGE